MNSIYICTSDNSTTLIENNLLCDMYAMYVDLLRLPKKFFPVCKNVVVR